jgi:hypothetical protein
MIIGLLTSSIFALFFLVPEVILFAIPAYFYFKELAFRQKAGRAMGTVTHLATKSGSGRHGTRSTSYVPVIHYQAQDGRDFNCTGKIGRNPPSYKVGQQVELYYDPQDPQNAHLPSFWSQSPAALACGIVGVVLACVGWPALVPIVMVVTSVLIKK